MAVQRYDIGDKVRLKATFTNQSDSAVNDPGGVVFKVKDPAGVITSYVYGVDSDVQRESTGVYYMDILPTTSGKWHFRAEGVTSGQAATEGSFIIERSRFTV